MTLQEEFAARNFVNNRIKVILQYNHSNQKITGGEIRAVLFAEDGDGNPVRQLRRDVPMSIFTVTAQQRNQLQNFIASLVNELLTETGKTIKELEG